MPNYSSKLFQGVAKKNVKKSFQDLSYEWKHDFKPGYLIPFLKVPTLPGDEFTVDCEFFFKFEPLYFPMIHRMKFEADLYYIPNRIMWPETPGDFQTGWTNWIMIRDEFGHPTHDVNMQLISASGNDSVMGYFGLPYLWDDQGTAVGRTVLHTGLNAFPAMAYLMIWDQYYRNPHLEETRSFPLVSGDNSTEFHTAYGFLTASDVRMTVFPAKWDMDYFTAGLSRPQAGDAVQIPVVKTFEEMNGVTPNAVFRSAVDGDPAPTGNIATDASGFPIIQGGEQQYYDPANTAGDVRQLTFAQILQGFRESLLKIGQRYQDYIRGIFDEDPTPMDINVPVLFGTYKGTVDVSEVLMQADTTGEVALRLGDYAGNASLYSKGTSHRIKVNEHGLLIGIMSLRPTTSYGQGVNRYWRYSTPYDYPMDVFCGMGDQEVLNEELYFDNLTAQMDAHNATTFNYIPRYSEARTMVNQYGTNLASEIGLGLSTHLGRWFNPETMIDAAYNSAMNFGEKFLSTYESNDAGGVRLSDVFRILTLTNGGVSGMPVIGYVYNRIEALRPLPMYSTPGEVI